MRIGRKVMAISMDNIRTGSRGSLPAGEKICYETWEKYEETVDLCVNFFKRREVAVYRKRTSKIRLGT